MTTSNITLQSCQEILSELVSLLIYDKEVLIQLSVVGHTMYDLVVHSTVHLSKQNEKGSLGSELPALVTFTEMESLSCRPSKMQASRFNHCVDNM